MQCPRCQHANETGAKFCDECAAPLARRCAACGRQLSATTKFCPQCARPTGVSPAPPAQRYGSPESYTPKHLAERSRAPRGRSSTRCSNLGAPRAHDDHAEQRLNTCSKSCSGHRRESYGFASQRFRRSGIRRRGRIRFHRGFSSHRDHVLTCRRRNGVYGHIEFIRWVRLERGWRPRVLGDAH